MQCTNSLLVNKEHVQCFSVALLDVSSSNSSGAYNVQLQWVGAESQTARPLAGFPIMLVRIAERRCYIATMQHILCVQYILL